MGMPERWSIADCSIPITPLTPLLDAASDDCSLYSRRRFFPIGR